jgi:hypothetical protein
MEKMHELRCVSGVHDLHRYIGFPAVTKLTNIGIVHFISSLANCPVHIITEIITRKTEKRKKEGNEEVRKIGEKGGRERKKETETGKREVDHAVKTHG